MTERSPLHALLRDAADDLVPEHDPLGGRLDGVRRLVRRRRAVRRVQAGAGAVVGVAAIGSASLLFGPTPFPGPAGPPAVCGESFIDALPAAGHLDGFATIQASQGQSVTMRTQLENVGEVAAATVGEVQLVVSLPGTGRVVGHGTASPGAQTEIAPDSAGDVVTTATLVSCGFSGSAAGDPLPDGTYDLTLTGAAETTDGTEVPWQAATTGLTIEGGQAQATDSGGPAIDGEFAPVCGEMIPAVPENPMWASTAAAGTGPFAAGDPDEPYVDGVTLDLTIGTTSAEPLSGELSAEVVTVLTDLDGNVITWWRASDHGRPLDLGPELDLAAEGTRVIDGFAWFPVLDTCATEPTAIADGDYRIFTWVEVSVRASSSDAVEIYPMVSVPLDIEVSGGELSVG